MVSRRNKVSARLARGVSEAESRLELELELESVELVDVRDAYSAGAADMISAGASAAAASSAGGAASGLPRNLKKPAKP